MLTRYRVGLDIALFYPSEVLIKITVFDREIGEKPTYLLSARRSYGTHTLYVIIITLPLSKTMEYLVHPGIEIVRR